MNESLHTPKHGVTSDVNTFISSFENIKRMVQKHGQQENTQQYTTIVYIPLTHAEQVRTHFSEDSIRDAAERDADHLITDGTSHLQASRHDTKSTVSMGRYRDQGQETLFRLPGPCTSFI
jgi:hypothetical protein